jgi:hypothetical protein
MGGPTGQTDYFKRARTWRAALTPRRENRETLPLVRSLSAAGAVQCVVFAGLSRAVARRMLGCARGGRHIKSLTYWITELTGTATLEGG